MPAELILRPAVKQEIDEIISYYEKQKRGVGLLFLEILDMLLSRVHHHPEQFQEVHKQIRRAVLKDFPYNIYFRMYKNQIIVLAVTHQKRNPKVWKGRK